MLLAAASWLAPTAEPRTDEEEVELIEALDRLAQIDAEMDRLRTTQPPGWGSRLAVYAAEAECLRQDMALEYRRDNRGSVFLVRDGTALYYVPSAAVG